MADRDADTTPNAPPDEEDLVRHLRRTGALRFGEFELANGGTSEYYVDVYRLATDPAGLRTAAAALAHRVDDQPLAGVALGGVPLVATTAVTADVPYVIVRKAEKGHGTARQIEGAIPDRPVVVIEDVTTTGGSALDAVAALRDAGATVDRVLVLVDRESGAAAALADVDVGLESVLTVTDLLADRERQQPSGSESGA